MTPLRDRVVDIFRAKGWRPTAAVRNLADILDGTKIPLSVQELKQQLSARERKVDTTTVYRILERFVDLKLVHNLHGYFIMCTNPAQTSKDHHFLVCTQCGEAEEIFLDYRESITRQLAQEKNFILRDVDLIFRGLCGRCSGK